MDVLSFLLGIAGDVVKGVIIDLIRRPPKPDPEYNRRQQEEVRKLIAIEIAKYHQYIPKSVSPEEITRQVVEQIILLAANPNSPIKIQDGTIVLREPPLPKPLLAPQAKWTEKEIQARLWQLDAVIGERKRDIQMLPAEPRVTSKLPPLPDVPGSTQQTQADKRRDWESRVRETATRIDERRKTEVKPIEQTPGEDDAHS